MKTKTALFLLGFALSACILLWLLMRGPRLPKPHLPAEQAGAGETKLPWLAWRPMADCDDEDVPPYNFVMTRTDTGHSVTWTWDTNDDS